MDKYHCNHYSAPHAPLFLSAEELRSLVEVDRKGFEQAERPCQLHLQALATALVSEMQNFNTAFPDIALAGLSLTVKPMLKVYEKEHFGE